MKFNKDETHKQRQNKALEKQTSSHNNNLHNYVFSRDYKYTDI